MDYNLLKNASMLYVNNKFILTISFVQVSCERCFSAPKFIKNKLKSTVIEEHRKLQADVHGERINGRFNKEEILSTLMRKAILCVNLY